MALLERVATLLRANLNDLLDKAEDPAKMLKQVVLDMENQLLQVKTQVAIAVADQHVLEAKTMEHQEATTSWRYKAELALNRNDEALARTALERSLQSEQMFRGYARQLDDQRLETETLREQYRQLEVKLADTRAQAELLLQQHQRARRASAKAHAPDAQRSLSRMKHALTVQQSRLEAERETQAELSVDDRFRSLERQERVEALLQELKAKPPRLRG